MNILSGVSQAVRKATTRPAPRFLGVKKGWLLTPNMIRVTFSGPELGSFPEGREGGNCKLMLSDWQEDDTSFAKRLVDGPPPVRRTYTVRHYRADVRELDIDFVAHDGNAPASRWATHAKKATFLGSWVQAHRR